MEIRNFCIIAHIDHGKSTLADRFLEITNSVEKSKMSAQFLDSMDLEREKGITIKMHPVRLAYKLENTNYILNLIDTPGHIDFSYEISRALACCEAAVLLVDATQGVQAQTIFNLNNAKKQGLLIIPALNKIDAANEEQIAESRQELSNILDISPEEIIGVSAKSGLNAEKILSIICQNTPAPLSDTGKNLKALVFDSKYDNFSGVIAFVRIFQGTVKPNDDIFLMRNSVRAKVKEVGVFTPSLQVKDCLSAGEIGYIKTGIKEADMVKIGETITLNGVSDSPLPGYAEPSPVLFLSMYPQNSDNFELLKDGLNKLKLNDPSFQFQQESQMALGRGFRAGFLGALHAEIVARRIKSEIGLDLILTPPQVVFKVLSSDSKETFVSSANQWPRPEKIVIAFEPFCQVEIIAPPIYFNDIFKLFNLFSLTLEQTKTIAKDKILILAKAPLREIVSGLFYDKLKAVTSGYGSFAFLQTGYEKANLVKVDILIAGKAEPAFSKILPSEKAFNQSKTFLEKLRDVLPKQQFAVALQAVVGGKVIARETIGARRKDVTAPLYGGDITRKRKLLDIQKKGKKEMAARASLKMPPDVFLNVFRE